MLKNTIKKPVLFLAILMACLNLTILFPSTVQAISTEIHVIDRTRIRMDRASFSQADYDDDNASSLRSVYSLAELNTVLQSLFEGKDFEDGDIWDTTENYTFNTTYQNQDCTSEIKNFDTGDSDADVKLSIPKPRGGARGCVDITTSNVALGQSQEMLKAFKWVDESTIQAYQRDWVFTQDESNENKFWDEEEASEDCQNFIQLLASRGPVSVEDGDWINRGSAGRNGGCEDKTGEFWWGNAPLRIRIGQTNNRSIPPGDGDLGGGDADVEVPPSCESNNTNVIISWLLCGFIQFIDDSVTKLGNAADDLLNIDDSRYASEDLRRAWSYFRNIASFMLIIIGLIMVIGQAISKE